MFNKLKSSYDNEMKVGIKLNLNLKNPSLSNKNRNKSGRRKINWFNLLYDQNVRTNMARMSPPLT